jgi:DNA helicase HerA-like ATPase
MSDSEEIEAMLQSMNIHEGSFANLRRGLATIRRLTFLVPHAQVNAVDSILEYLDRGVNVVLEFGRHRDITAYMLVANMLARRIYQRYQEKTEVAMAGKVTAPTPLVITIEEAHKFLNHEIANQTIFGEIAREMRKYNVTLLVIDQRPSAIDEEIMSQLGTKITCLLDNEKDIEAVLAGVSGKNELKTVLARLAPKQQALIFGHAVPMPVAFRPKDWGTAKSYEEFSRGGDSAEKADKDIKDLFS